MAGVDGKVNGKVDGRVDGEVDGRVDGRVNGEVDGRVDGKERKDEEGMRDMERDKGKGKDRGNVDVGGREEIRTARNLVGYLYWPLDRTITLYHRTSASHTILALSKPSSSTSPKSLDAYPASIRMAYQNIVHSVKTLHDNRPTQDALRVDYSGSGHIFASGALKSKVVATCLGIRS
jgi:hypothetical protein